LIEDLPEFSRRDACGRKTCLPAVVCEGGAESVKEWRLRKKTQEALGLGKYKE